MQIDRDCALTNTDKVSRDINIEQIDRQIPNRLDTGKRNQVGLSDAQQQTAKQQRQQQRGFMALLYVRTYAPLKRAGFSVYYRRDELVCISIEHRGVPHSALLMVRYSGEK
jgi:hypothetical protein